MEDFSFSEFRKRIASFLDNDMHPDDQQQFIHEIKQHPSVQNEFDRDRAVREKLKEKLTRPSVSPNLIDSIKSKIGY